MKFKKGSHVDVVISFVIFIVFLMFVFILIKPAGNFKIDEKQTAEYLKLSIEDRASSEILLVHLINTSSRGNYDCLSLDLTGLGVTGGDWIAKNYEGNSVEGMKSVNLDLKWEDEYGFFKIYFSENKFNDYTTSDSLTCLEGEIKSVKNSSEFLERDILNLISDYNSDYDALKEEFKISGSEEFIFRFEYSNRTIVGPPLVDVKGNIYAEKYSISYLDKEGNKEQGYFILYVWG